MNINFTKIGPDNWRTFSSLKVKKEQDGFVLSNIGILAKAYAYRERHSQVLAILLEAEPIGLLLQRDYDQGGKKLCVLDQFMIAEKYQGIGYGKAAMKCWISAVEDANRYDAISLCYLEGDEAARNLYQGLGFRHTGEENEDEIVMEYKLRE